MAKQHFKPPVRVGDRLDLTVETLASSGDGISRHEGYTLFVPTAVTGDRVVAEVVKTTPRFGVTRILETPHPSADRIEPRCHVFPKCGGCKLQSLPIDKQMEFKVQVVTDSLKRIGKLEIPQVVKTIPAGEPFFYRNKGSFAVQQKSGKLSIGFFKQGSHEVMDSDRCDILHEPINQVKEGIRKLLEQHNLSIYDEIRHKGFFRGLIVRHSISTKETLVGLVTTKGYFPDGFVEETVNLAESLGVQLSGIVQNISTKKTNVILGRKNRTLWGKPYLSEQLDGIRFRLSLDSFFQVNPYQTIKLYNLIAEWAGTDNDTVLDAYCGIGGMGLWLAREGRRVIGIEEFPQAVADARESAELNGIGSCEFIAGTLEDHMPNLIQNEKIQTVILDPPRKGCANEVIRHVAALSPERVIYVSCNPSTLARDLRKFHDAGYRISDLSVIDMFPQTQHIETAVLLAPV